MINEVLSVKLEYSETTRLRTSDFDTYDHIKIHSILDLLQDLAGRHAEILGVGYDAMVMKGLFWVLMSTKIKILDNASYLDEITATTWPHPKGRVDFIRDYSLSVGDKKIVIGSSRWVVINRETRRLARASDIDYDGEFVEYSTFDELKKIVVPQETQFSFLGEYKASNNDLDHNGHMNNAKYLEMAYNMSDLEEFGKYKTMQIDFHHEIRLHDTVKVYLSRYNDALYFKGFLGDELSFVIKMEE